MRILCTLATLLFCCTFLLGLLSNTEVVAEEDKELEVVVTATRIKTPIEEVASSITVITDEELEQKQELTVLDALREVPGVDVVRSGGPGGNASVFMRGANSEHTLLLIDGIEANNPISTNRSFNFADLPVENIERIEILRGPQSTLYGSDAMGGVINIITKRGDGPPAPYASAEAGSYNTYNERAGVSGGDKEFDYSATFLRQDTHGISAAAQSYGNTESDSYENTTFSSRVGVHPTDVASLNLFGRIIDSESEIDNTGGFGGDDPNRLASNLQVFTRAELNVDVMKDVLTQTYAASFSHQHYADNNEPDELHPLDVLRSRYVGDLRKIDLQNNIAAYEGLDFVLGLETEEETGESDLFIDGAFGPFEDNFAERSTTTNAYYLQAQADHLKTVFLQTGVRVDDHSRFGSEVTWRAAPAIVISDLNGKLAATVGTGFKAPSLFQLYSSFGDVNLEEETSLGLDVGWEQTIVEKRVVAGVTYFHNRFDNLITFDPGTFLFSNVSEATTHGLESYLRSQITDNLESYLQYTYTDTEDEDTGLALLRRARHKVGLTVDYAFSDAMHANINGTYIGKRFDNDFSTFPATRTSLDGYVLCNVAVSYDVTSNVQLFARLDNLFDKEYEEVLGFGTYGATAFGGVKVRL